MTGIREESDTEATSAFLENALMRHNDRFLPAGRKTSPLVLTIREDDAIVAGVYAQMGPYVCFVDTLWVDEAHRGHGLGRQLMVEIERRARQLQARLIYLDTYDFQAPGFYRKLGYEEIGRIDHFVDGHGRGWLIKRLDGKS